MKKYSILSICLLSFSLVACSSPKAQESNEPLWISSPRAVYAEKEYITGLGYGETRNKAENVALKALTSFIVQDISVQTNASSQTSIQGNSMSQSQDIDEEIFISSALSQVVGLGIKEVYFDNIGTYYALAVLEKAQASSHYSDIIRKNTLAIEEYRNEAQKVPASFKALGYYSKAMELARENENHLIIMTSIDLNRKKLLEAQSPSVQSLKQEANKDAKNIKLALYVQGNENRKLHSYLVSTLAQYGIEALQYGADENAKYILNASIEFSNLPDQRNNKFVAYTVLATIKQRENSANIGSLSFSGRAGHASRQLAVDRALEEIKDYLENNFMEEINR